MERRATDSDGHEIVVTMSDEVSQAITDWATVAELYERKTESTLKILGQYFITKNQFVVFHSEIKFYISKGLSEDDQKILDDSSLYLNKKIKIRTDEMNQLRDARIIVNRKINKIYNRLLQELFPSFLPLSEQLPKIVTPPRARPVRIEDEVTVGYDEPKEDDATTVDDEFIYDEELAVNISSLSLREPVEEIPPHLRRSRFTNATKALPQDLFETPDNALMLLDPILETLKGKVIYEPCCGNGAIVRYLEKKGFTVIARDLYTTEVKQDYLVDEDPDYDVLITNPPFCLKHEFFEKAMLSGKPFILLLPLQFLTPKCSYDNIKKCPIDIIIMNPSPVFLNENADRQVGDCGWFIVNLTEGGRFSVERLPDI
jgi:hypothetical protein